MIGSLIEDQVKGAAGNWSFGAAAAMTQPNAIVGSIKQGTKPDMMAISTRPLVVSVVRVSFSWRIGWTGRNKT